MPKNTTTVLRVSAKADGYRREGFKFSIASTDIPLSLLSSAQLHRLKSDTMLTCKEVDVEPDLEISPDELTKLREQAAIGESVQELVPEDWAGSPAEYLVHLQEQITQAEKAKLQEPAAGAEKAPHAGSAKTTAKPQGK